MINALVAIDLDLGSSLAIRYAESISDLIDMTVQSVHVVVPDKSGPEPGMGWVRKTWETAMKNTDREDIERFLELENAVRPRFFKPKILLGDRQEELLHELQAGDYDLFIEGALPTFNPADFNALVNSRLYKLMPCPAAMIVKNLVTPQKAALLLDDDIDYSPLVSSFLSVLNKPVMDLDVYYCRFGKGSDVEVVSQAPDSPLFAKAVDKLKEAGWEPKACREITGSPKEISEALREYSLAASALKHSSNKKNPMAETLGRVLSSVLLCWG
ncbi:hypothetical protein SAMN02745216_04560 [Desulfatibacillum alkenivorans DSM 16219]|jgi:nucleotide-binding universal stress UspA family protein|uniref:Nucleotide-binding universal stress protein, UspA family n=1 Tax=Desulfatibacillum alkenivorans DSM 16219 TaxID=1121393 RepID=A0A1M6XL51_9BACT|nr:hypothetical protein [Desulfatibacillum alkenivorans]SHL06681.1 hypothetical protein SAMN02745216_04560 [Desulfatibacillum alkenivorans DSM 16219]